MASLICGRKVTDPELSARLQQTALLHLFVVSGAHLLELERGLERVRVPRFARWSAACVFTLFSGAQPPIARALVGLSLPRGRSRWAPNGRADTDVLRAGCLTLALVPSWIQSLSLALSWACALAISLPLGGGWRGALRKSVAVWLFLLPLLAPWGAASPSSWLLNLTVAPAFAALSLPLALIALAGGPFVVPFDRFMDLFLRIVESLSDPTRAGAANPPPPAWSWWLWIGLAHLAVHAILVTRRREAHAKAIGA